VLGFGSTMRIGVAEHQIDSCLDCGRYSRGGWKIASSQADELRTNRIPPSIGHRAVTYLTCGRPVAASHYRFVIGPRRAPRLLYLQAVAMALRRETALFPSSTPGAFIAHQAPVP
jgi:hypothetical protein